VSKQYLGHLPPHDPLWDYLRGCILPQVGVLGQAADFRVFSMKAAKVYLYEEKYSRAALVGKFFLGGEGARRMQQEFDNLQLLRGYGLNSDPHYVVRPLGANIWIDSVLVEEFCGGTSLSSVIGAAIYQNQQRKLYAKLTALAYFLATLHNRTANGCGVDFSQDCAYLDRLVGKLRSKHFMAAGEADELYWLRDRWREQPRMWEDRQVFVHGDATPSNFLFGDGLKVIAIDLERMKRADRVFDIGRIAGELQHFYLQAFGDKYAAEPFIGHFLWEYACHFPDRKRAFRSVTGRVAFQMALTLLRISRNSWIGAAHRRRLIEEAKITLRTF
jgi:aminoglycoside phosphotransferase (APT) family kinase protein